MHVLNQTVRLLSLAVACLTCFTASAAGEPRGTSVPRARVSPTLKTLRLVPSAVQLNGRYSSVRVLVDGLLSNGKVVDLSSRIEMSVADPNIASIENGFVYPKRDGRTALVVRFKGLAAKAPVVCRWIAATGPPGFVGDVMPILTRNGCSSG